MLATGIWAHERIKDAGSWHHSGPDDIMVYVCLSQHIDTGSFKPFQDLILSVFALSYVISWPKEYAHYKHEQEAKLAGGAAH